MPFLCTAMRARRRDVPSLPDAGVVSTPPLPLASQTRRAELHASLDRVLVIDMRFFWNGVGNSLPRWLASLRVGLAAGRATFLWMSDRGFSVPPAGRRLTANNGPAAPSERPLRSEQAERSLRHGRLLGAKMSDPPGHNGSIPRRMPWRNDPSRTPTAPYVPQKSNGFDLGEFFVAAGADWRWDQQSLTRVRSALASRNQSQVPHLARYYCRRHTWACTQPRFEYGLAGSAEVARPFPAGRVEGTQFGGPTVRDTRGGSGSSATPRG
jgi:hypothetical protein